jgi:hypothetical protein
MKTMHDVKQKFNKETEILEKQMEVLKIKISVSQVKALLKSQ